MDIDKGLIKKVAENARLALSEKEVEELLPEFKEVVEAFSILDTLDTTNVTPSFQSIEIKNVFRKDDVKKCLTQKEALSNSKHKSKEYFKGPRVV